MFQDRQFFQIGVNEYVPAMQYGAGIISHVPARFNLGVPATSAAGTVGTLIPVNTANGTVAYFTAPVVIDARYGRVLSATPSGVPGTNNAVDILGYDYLMQPMFERITGASAASSLIAGLKAFKVVVGTRINVTASNAITWSIGVGNGLGLPVKGQIVTAKEGTTVITNAQIMTNHTQAVLTNPATATTGDPRGIYTPTTAPNGVLFYELGIAGDNYVDASNGGGMYGIRHLAP
jgi:hypothetical protein